MNGLIICRKHKTCKDADKIDCPHRIKHQGMSYCGERRKNGIGCDYDKEAYCIPYNIREFKKGDKVRVLGKTTDKGYWDSLGKAGLKIGFETTIRRADNGYKCTQCGESLTYYLNIERSGAMFHPQDLELIKEDDKIMNENKPKYKEGDGRLTLQMIVDSARSSESENFIRHYLKWSSSACVKNANLAIEINDRFIEYAQQHDCFIKYLLKNGQLKKS